MFRKLQNGFALDVEIITESSVPACAYMQEANIQMG